MTNDEYAQLLDAIDALENYWRQPPAIQEEIITLIELLKTELTGDEYSLTCHTLQSALYD